VWFGHQRGGRLDGTTAAAASSWPISTPACRFDHPDLNHRNAAARLRLHSIDVQLPTMAMCATAMPPIPAISSDDADVGVVAGLHQQRCHQ